MAQANIPERAWHRVVKLPVEDTEVSYCWLCRVYHGYQKWCPFTAANRIGTLIFERWLIWYLKASAVVVIGLFLYFFLGKIFGFEIPGFPLTVAHHPG